MIKYIQKSATECYVTATFFDDSMRPKTGLIPTVYITVINSMTFGGGTWTKSTTSSVAAAIMCEVDAANLPGVYAYKWTTVSATSSVAVVRATVTDATVSTYANQYTTLYVGRDIEEASKNLNAAVSSRATPADVRSAVDAQLNTAIPAVSISGSIYDKLYPMAFTSGAVNTFVKYLDSSLASAFANAIWGAQRSSYGTSGTFGEGITSVIGGVGGNVLGYVGSLGTTAKADVKAQVDAQLNTALPASPVAGSSYEKFKKLAFDTYGAVYCAPFNLSSWTPVAEAVWKASRSIYGAYPGTYGEGVQSVQGNVTGSVGSLGATAKSEVRSSVDSLLNTVLPATPTANSAYDKLKKLTFGVGGVLAVVNGGSVDSVSRIGAGGIDSDSLHQSATNSIAQAVWSYATSSVTSIGTIGKSLLDSTQSAAGSASVAASKAYDLQTAIGSTTAAVTTLSENTSEIGSEVHSILIPALRIPMNPASVGSAMTLADGAITASKIGSDAITSGKIAAGAIGASEIADGAITAAKIADGAITDAKAVSVGAVNGNISGSVNNIREGVSITEESLTAIRENIPTTDDIPTDALSNISDKIDLIYGTGRAIYTHTVYEGAAPSTAPLSGCLIWITADINGDEYVAGPQLSNEIGKTKWMLDVDKTYYVWCQKPRYTFSNPQTIQVS